MRHSLRLCSCLFIPLICGTAAYAETAPTLMAVRASPHGTYDRVVFDLNDKVHYKITRENGMTTVRLSAKGHPSLKGLSAARLHRLKQYGITTDKEGHAVFTFGLSPTAVLRDSINKNSLVLDILDGARPPAPAPAPAPTPTPAPPKINAPSEKAEKADESKLAPKPTAAAPVLVTPAPLPDITLPATQNAETTTPAPAPATETTPSTPDPTNAAKSSAPALQDMDNNPVLVASLDPHMPVRLVAWQRGGYGYVLFDRKIMLSASALGEGQPPPRITLLSLDLPNATGFRFVLPPHTDLRTMRNGTVWQIFLIKEQFVSPVSAELVAQPNFALGARFLVPQPNASEPIPMTDPIVGDNLIVVPLADSQVFSAAQRMADFAIIPAAQGLVIKPLTDKVVVRDVSDGVEITADGGLHLSSATDTGGSQQSTQKALAEAAGKSLFDFATWRGRPGETFTQTRQRRQQIIVDVPEPERNRARLELAHFYFAWGNGAEALAILNLLAKEIPDLRSHPDFLALTGACKILAYRPDEGLKDLEDAHFHNQPEIELWQAIAYAELRNWNDAEERFSVAEGFLNGYPEPFYSRFTILAIEAAFAAGKDKEGEDWLDRFETSPHADSATPAIEYLHGVIHAKAGRAEAASDSWKEVAASHDQLYKIRAELALIDLGVSTGSLTPAQAADQLEALRFGWRGDDLEVDILHRLGHFYIDAKNVKAGLGVLARAIQLYPDSPITPELKAEMSNTFEDVFLGSLGKDLSPLDALTIYQQYKYLMPNGEDGDSVIRNLAERLVAIDLLDQAGDLLEELVRTHLQGDEKVRVGTRLAAIRLLDHKPDEALTALDLSKDGETTAHLKDERLLLRARALSQTKHADEAMALLKDKDDEGALRLRADIAMHAQKWDAAAATLQALIGPPPRAGAQISSQKVDWVVNDAMALALAGDQTGLDKLAIDFGPVMAGTPKNDVFRLLTKNDKTGPMRDIAAAQASLAEVDLFRGFLDTYRQADPAPKKAEKKP